MGLLDALGSDDAKLGIALLSASGYSPTPMSFGQRLGGALGQYNAERTATADRALRQKLLQSQLDENASQNLLRQAQLGEMQRKSSIINSVFGGQASGSPSMDVGVTPGISGAPGISPMSGATPGGSRIASMTPDQIAQLKLAGVDLSDIYKMATVPTSVAAGSYSYLPGQAPKFMADPSKLTTIDPATGRVSLIPGALDALAAQTQVTEGIKGREGARYQEGTPTFNPDGTKSVRSRLEMYGGGSGPVSGDPYINAIIKTESNGNPNAVSPKGAQGLMQVMPGTNTSPGFGVAPAKDLSEAERTRVGQDYWKAMNERYQNPTIAAIAYNWGPGNTDLWLKAGGDFNKLPAETKSYVAQVMTRSAVNSRQPTASNVVELSPAQQAQNKADEAKLVEGAKADVARDTEKQKASKLYGQITSVAQQAMRLLEANPTGSGVGALADSALNFIGQPTKSGNVAQSLETISGWMTANVPRMEGPQSNIDILNYQTMAGRVGDRTLPVEARKAALREAIALQNKYAELNGSKPQEAQPSGLPSGWSVKVK